MEFTNRSARVKQCWQSIPGTPCGMMKMDEHADFEAADKQETLQLLPPLSHARIAELGAGIGRFTGELSGVASGLTCIEFVPEFLEKNRQLHQDRTNIDFILADAMDVEFAKESLDFVFVNWLLLYLNDDEAETLIARIANWLAVGGRAFFRETCAAVLTRPTPSNPAHYRLRATYKELFRSRLHLIREGSLTCWLDYMNQPFSCYWLVEKRLH
jgi:SAM-dependent methyltransferase